MNDDIVNLTKEKDSKKKFSLPPLTIHIVVLLLLFLVVGFFLYSDFSFEKGDDPLVLIGDLESFSQNFIGDIEVYSADFNLETDNGKFDGENTDFIIKNFNGLIQLDNESIIFNGTSDNISFEKNVLQLNQKPFTLKSTQKTDFSFFIKETIFEFKTGRLKYGDDLNFDFMNSSLNIKNFNTSVTYDGTFSFTGFSDSFSLNSPQKGLVISYTKQEEI